MQKASSDAGVWSGENWSCGELGAGDAWVLLHAPLPPRAPSLNRNNVASLLCLLQI